MKLVCANGSPWPCGPCAKCAAEVARLMAEADRDTFFGVFDAAGYTPADRRAQAKTTGG
jgi:hypothetical protein